MRHQIDNHIVLLQEPEGPFKSYLSSFAASLDQLGYARKSIHYRVRLAACFSGWIEQQKVKQASVATDHCQCYLRHRSKHQKIRRDDHFALMLFLDYLRKEKVIPIEEVSEKKLTSLERCAQSYEQYLYEVRGLSQKTVVNYMPFVCSFLAYCFGVEPVRLARISASDVVKFVQHQAPRLHNKRAKLMTSALRSFLNYACYSNQSASTLVGAVPIVANWSMPAIPRAISTDQVNKLLSNFDKSTASGSRDYAILVLISRLGLRLSEVTFLELNDINWQKGSVKIRGKGGKYNEFPLTPEIGDAIATYLHKGRPKSLCRRVFLRNKAPIQGFRSITGINSIIRRALERHDIQAPTFGAHQFRHSLATEMLRQGASLGEIGDVLGHRNPQTTTIYTKVDSEALRKLAVAWPGDVR